MLSLERQPFGPAAAIAPPPPPPAGEGVDVHCHCLPGVDDGPATMEEALDLCRLLIRDGTGTVVATPHQLGRYDGRNAGPAVREAVAALNAALAENELSLTVLAGGEVRIDERIPALLKTGDIATLAGAGYLLLELPTAGFTDPLPLIRWLAKEGVRTVVAHPERHHAICRKPEVVLPWVESGAALQVNAPSLLGEAGPEAQQTAWRLLSQPLPLLVAGDAHNTRSRPPRMTRAREQIERRLGAETARRVCLEIPREIIGAMVASGAVGRRQ